MARIMEADGGSMPFNGPLPYFRRADLLKFNWRALERGYPNSLVKDIGDKIEGDYFPITAILGDDEHIKREVAVFLVNTALGDVCLIDVALEEVNELPTKPRVNGDDDTSLEECLRKFYGGCPTGQQGDSRDEMVREIMASEGDVPGVTLSREEAIKLSMMMAELMHRRAAMGGASVDCNDDNCPLCAKLVSVLKGEDQVMH